MCFIDDIAAARSALDLAARLASGGRARVDADDVLDHLEAWEPGTSPVAVRLTGSEIVVVTTSAISPASKRVLTAYAPPGATILFRVVECADAE